MLIDLLNDSAQKISLEKYDLFPLNQLSALYYFIVSNLVDEQTAQNAHKRMLELFEIINHLDDDIEGSGIELVYNKPTTWQISQQFSSPIDMVYFQTAPLLSTFTKHYQQKLKNKERFDQYEMLMLIQIISSDAFLYSALVKDVLKEKSFKGLDYFLYLVQQANDILDDLYDMKDDYEANQPNFWLISQHFTKDPEEGRMLLNERMDFYASEIAKIPMDEKIAPTKEIISIFKQMGNDFFDNQAKKKSSA
ncbi:hypothetical protein C4564_05160 [Candidatus Microgenomates bacterium]|nr:MAG: hypothetical protein C4564_05160 [Candidatus Microgenomates bacterium]